MKTLLVACALLAAPLAAAAQTTHAPGSAHGIIAHPGSIQWAPAPASLPPGARVVVLEGDPSQPGPFTMRLWLPDGYRIPPHFHPGQERVTVISGVFALGMGDKEDSARLTELAAGAYASMPAGMAHFARARGETVVQLNNVGPWGLTYVNPADDPRRK